MDQPQLPSTSKAAFFDRPSPVEDPTLAARPRPSPYVSPERRALNRAASRRYVEKKRAALEALKAQVAALEVQNENLKIHASRLLQLVQAYSLITADCPKCTEASKNVIVSTKEPQEPQEPEVDTEVAPSADVASSD